MWYAIAANWMNETKHNRRKFRNYIIEILKLPSYIQFYIKPQNDHMQIIGIVKGYDVLWLNLFPNEKFEVARRSNSSFASIDPGIPGAW